MTFHVKLAGVLHYADANAAAGAHTAMMAGRSGNEMLEDGARIDGDTIVFAFDNIRSTSTAPILPGEAKTGIESALETAITGSVVYSDESGAEWVRHALGREFWARRWKAGQTSFHEGAPNDLLTRHVARVETKPRLRIFVPLCGKTFDMRWLAERGHEVVGVEVVSDAVTGFFEDWKVDPARSKIGGSPALSANGVTLVCGDMFAQTPEALGKFDVIYDRAALVALEPSTRASYVERCKSFLGIGGVTFLVTLAYDQSLALGPPWSIDPTSVQWLFSGRPIEALETHAISATKRLAEAGIATVDESAYLIG
jgi:thiopurine S-methyltransferase